MDLSKLNPEAFKGTLFDQIFEVMNSGDYSVIEGDPDPGEEVIGTMTELEKALYTVAIKNITRAQEVAARLDGKGKPFSSEELPQLRREYYACKLRMVAAKEMLWSAIKERLHECELPDNFGIGVRGDFCIVMMTRPSDPIQILDIIFGGPR